MTLKTVATAKLRNERLISSKSYMPNPSPIPMMGPISGEINIAPIITAGELTFNPNEAMKMAKIRIQIVEPLNSIPLRIDSTMSDSFSRSWL